MTLTMTRPQDGFAGLLKSWRNRRRMSQIDLALSAGLSQRHLSFLETGRSRPSRYAVQQISEALDMPAAEFDMLLMAAGFAPLCSDKQWDAGTRAAVDLAIDHVLKGHEPYPAVSIDRIWNLKSANRSALNFFALAGGTGQPNLLMDLMAPGRLRDTIANWAEVVRALYRLLDLELARRPHDAEGKALLGQLRALPGVSAAIEAKSTGRPAPVVAVEFGIDGRCLRLFSLIATIGMSMDAALDDVRIETLLPADASTREWFENR